MGVIISDLIHVWEGLEAVTETTFYGGDTVLWSVLKLREAGGAANFSPPGSRVTCLKFSRDNWMCNGIMDTSMWKRTY